MERSGSTSDWRPARGNLTLAEQKVASGPGARPWAAWSRVELLTAAAVGILALVGLLMRLVGLGRGGLTFDEAGRVAIATLPLAQLLHGVQVIEVSPPLYAVLLHGWLALVGRGDEAARLFSALLILPTVPVAWSLGRVAAGREGGLLLPALVAVNPFAVHYGQQAAMYALLLGLSLAYIRAAIGVLESAGRTSTGWLIAYVGCGILALYTHYYAFFLLASISLAGLLYLAIRRCGRGIVVWSVAHLVVVGAFLPWLPTFLLQARVSAAVDEWNGVITPIIGLVLWAGALLADEDPLWRAVGVPLLVAGSALGVWHLRRTGLIAGLLGALTILPLIFALLTDASLHTFRPRGFLAVAGGPWLLLIAAVACGPFGGRPDRVARLIVGVGLVLATVMGLQHHASEQPQEWSGAAALVAERGTPEEPIFLLHYALQLPFDHYFAAVTPTDPADWTRIGLPDSFTWETGYTAPYHVSAADVQRRVGPAIAGRPGAWVVAPSPDYTGGGQELLAYLDSRGSRTTDVQLTDVHVVGYRLPREGSGPL